MIVHFSMIQQKRQFLHAVFDRIGFFIKINFGRMAERRRGKPALHLRNRVINGDRCIRKTVAQQQEQTADVEIQCVMLCCIRNKMISVSVIVGNACKQYKSRKPHKFLKRIFFYFFGIVNGADFHHRYIVPSQPCK